ncbi:MAG: (2Fe-2S)-binding protein [Pseudomonadota bacterium]
MYVCICNAVTEKAVRDAAHKGARSLEDLKADLGVATCCGQCADRACAALAGVPGQPLTAKKAAISRL